MKKALVLAGGGSRGAFQIGVWKYLTERNWKPDIICGTSVGAINAAWIGSGLDVSSLIRLWTIDKRRKMYRLNLVEFLSYLLSGRGLKPLFDTRQIQSIVSENLDFNTIKNNRTKIVVSTVNVHTAQPCFFENDAIKLEHILASSAMPILFPPHNIDGVPHWDGGIMANIPLQPALDFGAQEIIIVMLSPIGHTRQVFPKNIIAALEHVFEQFLAGPYYSTLITNKFQGRPLNAHQCRYTRKYNTTATPGKQPDIITLAPSEMLGFWSLINFSLPQAKRLIDEGYKTANTQLKPFI